MGAGMPKLSVSAVHLGEYQFILTAFYTFWYVLFQYILRHWYCAIPMEKQYNIWYQHLKVKTLVKSVKINRICLKYHLTMQYLQYRIIQNDNYYNQWFLINFSIILEVSEFLYYNKRKKLLHALKAVTLFLLVHQFIFSFLNNLTTFFWCINSDGQKQKKITI